MIPVIALLPILAMVSRFVERKQIVSLLLTISTVNAKKDTTISMKGAGLNLQPVSIWTNASLDTVLPLHGV